MLISHESDFFIAEEKHWLLTEVTQHGGPSSSNSKIDARFIYRELRLSRLVKIYRHSQRPLPAWLHVALAPVRDDFAWLASAAVCIAIVLTAIQVGLAMESVADNDAFQSASYGFNVFLILGPLVAKGRIILAFCYVFVNN